MFELNGTYLVFLLSFIAFVFALDAILVKPVGEIIEKRRTKIRTDVDASKASRAEAEETLAKYQKHLQSIRHDAQKVINDATAEAQAHRNTELSAVQEEGRTKLAAAKDAIAKERESLVDSLVLQEVELVKLITSKLVGETSPISIDSNKVRRTIEEHA